MDTMISERASDEQSDHEKDVVDELELNKEAFVKFKAHGSFYKQKQRQIITMDNNGGLHYE